MKTYNANVFFPGNLNPVNREVVLADDVAALREELAAVCANYSGEFETLQRKLTAAEQRNERLVKAATEFMEYAESGWDHFPDVGVTLRAALTKPAESGASEAERKEDDEALQRRHDQERAEYFNDESEASE